MIVPLVHVEVNPADADAYPIKFPTLDSTVGMLLVATFIGLILLGVTFHQAYRYARNFPHDSSWLKGLVAFVVLLDVVSSVLTMHACYHWLVTDYFHPQGLSGLWSINIYTMIAGVSMVLSQSFFARRVWLLDPRYRPVVILCCVISLAELAVFVAYTITEVVTDSPTNSVHLRLIPTAFCLAMCADLILTVALIHILRRKRTGFIGTDNMIDVLMMYSVNTGLLNGVFDLLTAVFAFTHPLSFIWAIFGVAGAKLYAITLLAALHSRSRFRAHGPGMLQKDTDAVFGLSLPQRARPVPYSGSNAVPPLRRGQLNVHQTRSTSTLDGEDVVELKVISPTLES